MEGLLSARSTPSSSRYTHYCHSQLVQTGNELLSLVFMESALRRILSSGRDVHMSGNSQSIKRPYLGHKVILCNALL